MDKRLFNILFNNYKEVFKNHFNSSVEVNEKEALELAEKSTVLALAEVVSKNRFDSFTRENNIRNDIVEYGVGNIKKELCKYIVYYYDYYKVNDSDRVKELNYNYNELTDSNSVVVSLYLNLLKYGVDNLQKIFDDIRTVNYLCESYLNELLVNKRIDDFNDVRLDENRFLLTSINSYFASNL